MFIRLAGPFRRCAQTACDLCENKVSCCLSFLQVTAVVDHNHRRHYALAVRGSTPAMEELSCSLLQVAIIANWKRRHKFFHVPRSGCLLLSVCGGLDLDLCGTSLYIQSYIHYYTAACYMLCCKIYHKSTSLWSIFLCDSCFHRRATFNPPSASALGLVWAGLIEMSLENKEWTPKLPLRPADTEGVLPSCPESLFATEMTSETSCFVFRLLPSCPLHAPSLRKVAIVSALRAHHSHSASPTRNDYILPFSWRCCRLGSRTQSPAAQRRQAHG